MITWMKLASTGPGRSYVLNKCQFLVSRNLGFANCCILEKTREFQKNIYFCFIDYSKAFDCVDYNKLWEILKEMGIPDHLTCLLQNLYVGQEATFRTRHGTTDRLKIRKEILQSCILSPYLFSSYVEYIMQNAGLDEAQAGIKIGKRNINNLRYQMTTA